MGPNLARAWRLVDIVADVEPEQLPARHLQRLLCRVHQPHGVVLVDAYLDLVRDGRDALAQKPERQRN